MARQERRISAQVILRDRDAAAAVSDHFAAAGFETDPLVGTSFAISASPGRFHECFGEAAAGLEAAAGPAELPVDALPAALAGSVEAIAVPGPPDFGPTAP